MKKNKKNKKEYVEKYILFCSDQTPRILVQKVQSFYNSLKSLRLTIFDTLFLEVKRVQPNSKFMFLILEALIGQGGGDGICS